MMDALLTPLVNAFLNKYIKRADGASQLRVSLSKGLTLHNLELVSCSMRLLNTVAQCSGVKVPAGDLSVLQNLDRLAAHAPLAIDRAYAKSLTIHVPWAVFGSRPILVRICSGCLHHATGP